MYNIRMDIVFTKDSHSENQSNKTFKDKVIAFFKRYDSNFYFFLQLCVIGVLFFATSLLKNQWTTLFGGDYTAQQLSFYTNGYDDWWHFFKTGEFRFFDTNTFLGASNIGANSFYYFFDPFFFPILLCPRAYIAQGMAFLAIFKIATAGMFFTKYMSVMGASKKASRLTGMAYAFSGWMAWFLWFNHMTEVMIVFPIMLWGVERVLRDKKPWLLMFGIFLMGLTNYFFLIGMGIAAFFYAIFRYFQRLKLNNWKENLIILGIGFIGFLGGLLLSCCVVIPAALYSLDAPRAANSGYLDVIKDAIKDKKFDVVFKMLFSWKEADQAEYRHFYPLINLVYPCASCRGTPLTQYGNEYYDNCATNIYVYIPMLLFFLPAFIKAMKDHKWSAIVALVLFLFALETPFAYYLFFGFTAPYGRWELFFITSFLTFTGLYIDHVKKQPLWTDIVSYVFVIALAIVGAIFANTIVKHYDLFVERAADYISLPGAAAILCIYTTVVFVIIFFLKKKDSFEHTIGFLITAESILMGFLTIEGHWCGTFIEANNGLKYNTDIYQLNRQIAAKDKNFYRIWTYNQNEGARNDGMRNDYNGLGCFHSLYNFNLNNFLNWTKVQDNDTFYGSGSWAASYVWKNADLDKFLGVKYYFIQNNYPQYGWLNDGNTIDNTHPFQLNVPLDYEKIYDYKSENYEIFEDKKTVNFAFGFDSLTTYPFSTLNKAQADTEYMPYYASSEVIRNDEMLLESAILDNDSAAKILEKYPGFSAKSALESRTIKKTELRNGTDISVKMFDLHQATDGEKYSVNTFFEDYAKAYLNGAHALTSADLVTVDEGKFKSVSSFDSENTEYGRYVNVITSKTGNFDSIYDPEGYSVYVPYYYNDNYRADMYLVDEDNKIITWDRHQDDKYQIGGIKYRGLFVHPKEYKSGDVTVKAAAPKLKKIIIAQRHNKFRANSSFSSIYAEKYSDQQLRYASLKNYEIKNIVYKEDASFKFTTDFDKDIFVVTQIPFEKGWRVTAKDASGKSTKLDVYSAQGGFVGFVAPKGNYSYSMSFYPSTLPMGKALSAVGAAMFVCSFVAYSYFFQAKEDEKKDKKLFNLY